MSDRLERLHPEWRPLVAAAVAWLRERDLTAPTALVLGSGLGNLVDALEDPAAAGYAEIPGFAATSVAEHAGRLVRGRVGTGRVLVMQGRLHPYEGLPARELMLPTAVLAALGVGTVVVTNAAGGLNRFYRPGDLMVVRDHVDFHGRDPLRGLLAPADPGPRPGPPRPLYDEDLARTLQEVGAACRVPLHAGTYASMWGPNYETRAEIGMLRRLGCDAVGMSTAPEVALLGALGVRVAGLSCITNPARETGQPELSHQDVVDTGLTVRDRMARLLLAFLPRLEP